MAWQVQYTRTFGFAQHHALSIKTASRIPSQATSSQPKLNLRPCDFLPRQIDPRLSFGLGDFFIAMDWPNKRPRLNSVVPPEVNYQDIDLHAAQVQNDQRLKSKFENIFAKYGRDFTGVGDEIDLETGDIVVDNGHLSAMRGEQDVGDVIQNTQMSGRSLLRALTVVPESQNIREQDRNAHVNGRSLLRALTVAPDGPDIPFDSVEQDSQDTTSGDEGQSFAEDEWDEFGEELGYGSKEGHDEQALGGQIDPGYDSSDSDDSILGPKKDRNPLRDTYTVQTTQSRTSVINDQKYNARRNPVMAPRLRPSIPAPAIYTTRHRHSFGNERPPGARLSLPAATPNTREHGHSLDKETCPSLPARTNDTRRDAQPLRNGIAARPRPSLPATYADPTWHAPPLRSVYATQPPRNGAPAISDRSYSSEPRPVPAPQTSPSVSTPTDPTWYAPPLGNKRSTRSPQPKSVNLSRSVGYTSPNNKSLWAPVQSRPRKKKTAPPVPAFSSPQEVRAYANVTPTVPLPANVHDNEDSDDPLQDSRVTTPGFAMKSSRAVSKFQNRLHLAEAGRRHEGSASTRTAATRNMPTPSVSRISTPRSNTKDEPIVTAGDVPSVLTEHNKKEYHIEYTGHATKSPVIYDAPLEQSQKQRSNGGPPLTASPESDLANMPLDLQDRKFYFASAAARRGIETRRRNKEIKEARALEAQAGVQMRDGGTTFVTRDSTSRSHDSRPHLSTSFPARNVIDLEDYDSDQLSMGLAGGSDQDVETNMELAEQEEVKSDQEFAPEASMAPARQKRRARSSVGNPQKLKKIQAMPRGMTEEQDALLLQKKEVEGLPWSEVLKFFPGFPYNKIASRYYVFLGPQARERRRKGLTIRGKARKVPVELDEKYILGVGDGTRENYIENRFSPSHRQQDDQSASADSLLSNDTRETTSPDTYADRPLTPLLNSTIQPFLGMRAPAGYDQGETVNKVNGEHVDPQPDFSGSSPEMDSDDHGLGRNQSQKLGRNRVKTSSTASTKSSLKGGDEHLRYLPNKLHTKAQATSVEVSQALDGTSSSMGPSI